MLDPISIKSDPELSATLRAIDKFHEIDKKRVEKAHALNEKVGAAADSSHFRHPPLAPKKTALPSGKILTEPHSPSIRELMKKLREEL